MIPIIVSIQASISKILLVYFLENRLGNIETRITETIIHIIKLRKNGGQTSIGGKSFPRRQHGYSNILSGNPEIIMIGSSGVPWICPLIFLIDTKILIR